MARSRNIKPSLFKNELLGVADPLLTILFEGLWCLADREGRLEDRPLRIKAEIFPYRELPNFNGYLTELERLGFIERYSCDGVAVIQVINFKKHQNPHNTERPSELPEKSDRCTITVKEPLKDGEITERAVLIPDSCNRIPDTLPAVAKAPAIQFDYKEGQWQGLKENKILIDSWKESYPAVDMRAEFQAMKSWLLSNPKNRKTNLPKFINNWLSKAQDRASKPERKTFYELTKEQKKADADKYYAGGISALGDEDLKKLGLL